MDGQRGTVAVTGAGGFLGRHLLPALMDRGWSVTALDMVEPPRWADGVTWLRGDVRDAARVAEAVEGASAVVHAAFAPPSADQATLHAVNVTGTSNVLHASSRAGVERLVAVSSTIVDRQHGHRRVPWNPHLARLDAYRRSRVVAEEVLLDARTAGPRVAIVRPKTFVGPGQVSGFALVFSLIREGAVVPLLGPGDNRYQLLDVRDFADGLVLLAEGDATGVFELGAATFGTIASDLQALIDLAGTTARIRRIPGPVARGVLASLELAGGPPLAEWHYCSALGVDSVVDTRRAHEELGWEPRWSNREALAASYESHVGHRDAALATGRSIPASHRALSWVLVHLP